MAGLGARLRRWTYLAHRWCGIAGCLLMALWFASGVVMLFVGYPKLAPWDRVKALPLLPVADYLAPAQAMGDLDATRLTLNAAAGRPRYVLRRRDGSLATVDALTGAVQDMADAGAALRSAQLFLPGAAARNEGTVWEDRWTHSGALNPHRPLHRVQMDDAAHTLLYVSSRTAEVVMQAPRAQRWWNFAGAWLHWLYVFKSQPSDPVWTWTVIALSSVCVLVACSGIAVGLWRWRFARPYKSGSHSPFAPGWMRWHHVLGLCFAAITLTWIFSGLMSMNPLGVFSAAQRPDLARYAGAMPGERHLQAAPREILQALSREGFRAVELEWKNLAGRPYVLARDGGDGVRVVTAEGARLAVSAQWPQSALEQAATALLPAPVASSEVLHAYDAYYYRRDPEAMMGGSERRLPVLRISFADAGATQAYIDMRSGQVELSADRAQRTGRWLFSFLHSWDLRAMLAIGWLREAVLVLFSVGGFALAASGVVIGWRRLRKKAARRLG